MKTDAEVLKERALRTAGRNKVKTNDVSKLLNVVAFQLQPERFAFGEKFISEVLALKEITPVPGTPLFVMGVINLRGRIVSIINLKTLFNLKDRGLTELNKVLILKNENMEFGIVADSVIGNQQIDTETLSSPPITLDQTGTEFISGVDISGLILLDASQILNSNKLIVK